MALLKKIDPNWEPAENRGLQVGEVIDFPGDYQNLVKTGLAILVDEDGTELPLPMTYQCSICYNDIFGLMEFVEHVLNHAPQRKEEQKAATEAIVAKMESFEESTIEKEKPWKDMTPEEQKAKRIANLAKARAARKAKSA